jgi:hypothetical protein
MKLRHPILPKPVANLEARIGISTEMIGVKSIQSLYFWDMSYLLNMRIGSTTAQQSRAHISNTRLQSTSRDATADCKAVKLAANSTHLLLSSLVEGVKLLLCETFDR